MIRTPADCGVGVSKRPASLRGGTRIQWFNNLVSQVPKSGPGIPSFCAESNGRRPISSDVLPSCAAELLGAAAEPADAVGAPPYVLVAQPDVVVVPPDVPVAPPGVVEALPDVPLVQLGVAVVRPGVAAVQPDVAAVQPDVAGAQGADCAPEARPVALCCDRQPAVRGRRRWPDGHD